MKYVVSGASGPIGIAFVNLIVEKGNSVIVLTSGSQTSHAFLETNSIRCYKCDLQSYKNFSPDFTADIFIHMAWVGGSSRNDIFINQASMIASVDAVNLASRIGCHSFIGIGTQAEYGLSSDLLSTCSPCFPVSPFAAAKLSSMHNCSFRCSQLGLRFAWARVFSVYGPYDRPSSLVTSTINNLIQSRPLSFTLARNNWDFLHSYDAASALLSIANNSGASGIFNVASGVSLPLSYFIDVICQQFHICSKPYLGLLDHPSSSMSLNADISRLLDELNWHPVVEFSEGITALIKFQNDFLSI